MLYERGNKKERLNNQPVESDIEWNQIRWGMEKG